MYFSTCLLLFFFFQISPSKNSINDFPKFFSYFSDFSLVYKHIHQIPTKKNLQEKKRPDLASSAVLNRPSWGVNAFNNSCDAVRLRLPLDGSLGSWTKWRDMGPPPSYKWRKIHGRSHLPTIDSHEECFKLESLDTHDGLPPSNVRDDGCVHAMYVLCL